MGVFTLEAMIPCSSLCVLLHLLLAANVARGQIHVSADSASVRLVGRFAHGREGPQFDMNGCEVQFNVKGATSVSVLLSQQVSPYVPGPLQPSGFQVNNFVAFVDGVMQTQPAKGSNCSFCTFDTSLGKDGTVVAYRITEDLSVGVHSIRLVKATEPQWVARVPAPNWVTFHGLELDAGDAVPPSAPRPTRRLEFVGDSITAGYCNLCAGPSELDNASVRRRRRAAEGGPWEELFTLAWPYRICEGLGAECHTSAWSGFGMIENCCGGSTTMPEVWLRTLATDSSSSWDFSSWIPQGVVINLGTNDNVWARNASYSETYWQMVLNASRAYGPDVHFFLACGPMENELIVYCPYVEKVVSRAVSHGLKAHFFDLRGFLNGSFGPACCGHPSVDVDAAMGQYGVDFISSILGWNSVFPAQPISDVAQTVLADSFVTRSEFKAVADVMNMPLGVAEDQEDHALAVNNSCVDAFTKAPLEAQALMLFATGKPFFDQGAYWVCKNINQHDGLQHVQTKHFTVGFSVHGKLPAEIGLCLPSVCLDADINFMLSYLLNKEKKLNLVGLTIPSYSTDYPQPKDTLRHPNPVNDVDDFVRWSDKDGAPIAFPMVVAFTTALVMLTCFSTHVVRSETAWQGSVGAAILTPETPVRDAFNQARGEGIYFSGTGMAHWKIVKAFTLSGPTGTWTTLWQRAQYRPTDSLNGLRVISMLWIIMGHSFLITGGAAGYSNPEDVVKTALNPNAAGTSSMWPLLDLPGLDLSVDTFFFISGFLASFNGMSRDTPVVKGACLRYVRLAPCLAFAMAFYVCVLPYVVMGPFAPRFQNSVFRRCRTWTWWSPLVFAMNFVPWYNDDVCMGWTWYLGNDMIFAICGLILLKLWRSSPRCAWTVTTLVTLASFGVTIAMVMAYNLEIFAMSGSLDYQYYLYDKPWSRIPAFLVGLVAPWMLNWAKNRYGLERGSEPRSRLAVLVARTYIFLAVCLILTLLFVTVSDQNGPYGSTRTGGNWNDVTNAMYITFARPVWALAHCAIVVGCFFDYAPIINGFLSHWLWTPLTRLTFNAYLWHPLIINLRCGLAVQYYQFSTWMVLEHWLTDAILAYGVAVVAWCLVEKPVATLTGSFLKSS